ncbi:SMP-30/gluconolactonase/LRE family protein [Phenylobacterium sp.]|uniref:SMP-30/gluconolactonase/LRE family protein n=1 Tax=Phenylobacterium sp. TaxID=1871053 RepID=UPI0027361F4E|nr:SMP-30/gluconolactonase/LRE family protein [Phenylobacterium sp.]MDP3854876.1 SMP-30/gluconolactonase/LRE family protein [Phenylobacterium sp.]
MTVTTSSKAQVLMTGVVLGESPRWRDGRLWFCDWGAQQLIALDEAGASEVVAHVPSFPFCIDFLADGRLLIVSSAQRRVVRREPDGSMSLYAELGGLLDKPWNEIVVDGRGNAYVNSIGFNFPEGEYATGVIALVTPDGAVRQVADEVEFPNGMAITPDNSTLILAESYGRRLTAFDIDPDGGLSNRRVWAEMDGHPDGICLDAEGAVWYADVPNQCCVRVREGGEVLQRIEIDRGCFSCALGGADGRTLFIVAAAWGGPSSDAEPTGQVLAIQAPAPAAERP